MIYRKEANYIRKVRNNLPNKINGAIVIISEQNRIKVNKANNLLDEALHILESIK